MEAPANTLNYFIAGYGVIFMSILIYSISLWVRWRKLKREESHLTELAKKRTNH